MKSRLAKSRILEFLGRDMGEVHPIQNLKEVLPDLAIFGGMIRDLTLGGTESFRSDIDLVSTASAEEILHFIGGYSPVRNRFGGFRFFFLGRPYDIWSLHDTWAVREGYVQASSIEDLSKTTFFTVDAALFNVRSELFYAPDFCRKSIEGRMLDINLIYNPFPQKMAMKAVDLSIRKRLKMSYRLCEFVLSNGVFEGRNTFYFECLLSHVKNSVGRDFEFSKQLTLDFSVQD
ncbi:hypothetical protein ABE525_25465 [Pseudomonas wadenswilerensis]|uniref:hypothetical protein n=1 Tax=Pseudomonas wadenswilerensis TaxID=1785161 RepID=UPI00320A025D